MDRLYGLSKRQRSSGPQSAAALSDQVSYCRSSRTDYHDHDHTHAWGPPQYHA